jgi:hypothetical protein
MTNIYLVENCFNDSNKVYIGKTKNPSKRKSNHKKIYGDNITYTIIDQVNSLKREDWEPLESYWIEQFRQWDFEVINKRRKGGSGPEFHDSGVKNIISKKLIGREYKEEWKRTASKPKPKNFGNIIRNKKNRSHNIVMSNKKHYEKGSERNKKISSSLKGKKHSSETIKKLSIPKPEGFGDKIRSKERNKKIGESNSKPINQIKNNKIINTFNSLTEASNLVGISVGAISACLKNKSKTSGGFVWKYKD